MVSSSAVPGATASEEDQVGGGLALSPPLLIDWMVLRCSKQNQPI